MQINPSTNGQREFSRRLDEANFTESRAELHEASGRQRFDGCHPLELQSSAPVFFIMAHSVPPFFSCLNDSESGPGGRAISGQEARDPDAHVARRPVSGQSIISLFRQR
ncbi:hypothetical protein MRX96_055582 [Rhipicephalus microplus]